MKYKVLKQILTPTWSFEVGHQVDSNFIECLLGINPISFPDWFELIKSIDDVKSELKDVENQLQFYTMRKEQLTKMLENERT